MITDKSSAILDQLLAKLASDSFGGRHTITAAAEWLAPTNLFINESGLDEMYGVYGALFDALRREDSALMAGRAKVERWNAWQTAIGQDEEPIHWLRLVREQLQEIRDISARESHSGGGVPLEPYLPPPRVPAAESTGPSPQPSRKVFIVHGRDDGVRAQVEALIRRLHLDPVILGDKPGTGRTIIEKLEQETGVAFAVVLLTPDDEGRLRNVNAPAAPRARQNVVLELGYLMGKLGRSKVTALYDRQVELPSDYHGVQYIDIGSDQGWQLDLARNSRPPACQ
ncbi:MAG: TIR domain-containing protein [Anaerolineae bacterium]